MSDTTNKYNGIYGNSNSNSKPMEKKYNKLDSRHENAWYYTVHITDIFNQINQVYNRCNLDYNHYFAKLTHWIGKRSYRINKNMPQVINKTSNASTNTKQQISPRIRYCI